MIHAITIRHDRVKAGHAGLDADAQGGTQTEAGGKRIHTFTADGNLTVINRGTFEYLIVAGGGGGGNAAGGGGGAGGMITGTIDLEPGVYAIVVGTGGAGGAASAGAPATYIGGTNGEDSTALGLTAVGGGGGGAGSVDPAVGGSGGGASVADAVVPQAGAAGTAGQGNTGGTSAFGAANFPGSGGGGKGAVGANSVSAIIAGAGGAGAASSISGAAVTYAGGGGGGTLGGGTAGAGGVGGGGAGSNSSAVDGTDATDGLGAGGGGGASNAGRTAFSAGGDGGDGIVIISYDTPVTIDERQTGFNLNLVHEQEPGYADAVFSGFVPEDHAEGNLYSARFQMRGRMTTVMEMFERGLGRWLEAWGYGLEPEFEGMIVEITFNLPPDKFTISLDPVVNKGIMRADLDGDGDVDRSTTLENLDSQDQYPISHLVLGGGTVQGTTVADQTVQQYLDLRSLPRPGMVLGGASGNVFMEIFVRGFWWTLTRDVYNQTAVTGTQSMSAEVKDILDSKGEYVSRQIREANTTVVTRELDSDRNPWDLVSDMTKLGDVNNNRWLAQMHSRRITQAVGRIFRLKQAAPPVVPPTI